MEYVPYFKNMCHQARLPIFGQHVRQLKRRRPPAKIRNNQNSPVVPQTSVPQPSQSMNSNDSVDNSSAMIDGASTASNNCSQNPREKITFNIKSNSAVRPHLAFEKHENIDKRNNSVDEKTENEDKQQEVMKTEITGESELLTNVQTVNIKEEPLPKTENTALFSNEQAVQIPQPLQLKSEKRPLNIEVNKAALDAKTEIEPPLKKNKLQIKKPFDLEVNKATTDAKSEAEQPLKKNELHIKELKQSKVVGLNLNSGPATMSRVPFDNLNKRSPFDMNKILDQKITALLKRIRTEVEAELLKN